MEAVLSFSVSSFLTSLSCFSPTKNYRTISILSYLPIYKLPLPSGGDPSIRICKAAIVIALVSVRYIELTYMEHFQRGIDGQLILSIELG